MANSKFRNALEASLRSSEERQVIREFYDMSYTDFLKYYDSRLNELIAATEGGRTRLKDRPYQLENIRYRKTKIDSGQEIRGFITPLPAGGGKTEIFAQSLLRTAKEITVNGRVRHITPPTAIIVPSVDLADQVYKELNTRFPDLLIGRRDGNVTDIQPLTVYVINSFMNDIQSGFINPKDLKLNIVDEAHRFLSVDRARELKNFLGVALLDTYSASPVFTNRPADDPNRGLYDLLGEDSIIPSPTNRELTDMEFLAPCHNVIQRIQLKSEDIPPEILGNKERLHDFLAIIKIKAAIEFYKTYEDPETGQKARGKPAIAFSRFVKDAQLSSAMFREAFAEMAANDNDMATTLAQYSDPTVIVSRGFGNRSVQHAMDRILPLDKIPPERRRNPQPRALMVQTASMLREGFDAPHLKVAIGHNTGPIVDQIQSKGRVRREVKELNPKTGQMERQVSFVLDQIVEIDGKVQGNPCLYYIAIDDPSVAKGVMTISLGPENINLSASEALEFKNREEMKALVLGEGSAAALKGHEFDEIWDKLLKHIHKESKKDDPAPFILDDEAIKTKLVAINGDDEEGAKQKTELRVSRSAVDQFRHVLGIPGQMNGLWLNQNDFERAIIGNDPAARRYRANYNKELSAALGHLKFGGQDAYIINGKPVVMQNRLDDQGELIPAFHCSAVPVFREKLDVLPNKTIKFDNKKEFADAVLYQVSEPEKYRKRLNTLLQQAETFYKTHRKPGQKTSFSAGEHKVEISNCIDDGGDVQFCVVHSGVGAFRRYLGIPEQNFSIDVNSIDWTVDQSDIVRITNLIDQGGEKPYPYKTDDWVGKIEVARLLRTSPQDEKFSIFFDGIKREYDEKENRKALDAEPIIRQGERVYADKRMSGKPLLCYKREQLPLFARLLEVALIGKDANWKLKTEITKGKWRTKENDTFFNELEEEFLDKRNRGVLEQDPIIRGGTTIKMELCRVDNSNSIVCYHVDSENDVIRLSGLALSVLPKTKEWLNRKDAAKAIGGRNDKTDRLFKELEEEYAQKEKAGTLSLEPIARNGKIINMERRASSKTSKPICYHKDAIQEIKAILGVKTLPPKTEAWRSKKEAAKVASVHPALHEGFKGLWSEMESLCIGAKPVVIGGHKVQFQQMRSGSNEPFCIHQSEDEWIARVAKDDVESKTKEAREELRSPRPAKKKDISPDSEHIADRSGRSRSKK